MSSLLRVDVKAVRKEAVRVAEKQFKAARTTQQRHDARAVLKRARRANGRTQEEAKA